MFERLRLEQRDASFGWTCELFGILVVDNILVRKKSCLPGTLSSHGFFPACRRGAIKELSNQK